MRDLRIEAISTIEAHLNQAPIVPDRTVREWYLWDVAFLLDEIDRLRDELQSP